MVFGKLETVPEDWKNISHVVNKHVVKTTKLSKLNTKLNSLNAKIFWCDFFNSHKNTYKQSFEKKIEDADNKITDFMGLVTTTVFNTKINEVEKKILDTSGFVSPTVLNTKIVLLENKIPNFSNLAKKTDHNAKISGIKKKIILLTIIIKLRVKYMMQR